MEQEDLTEKIIGCAYKVYNELGFGFLESIYEKAILIELAKMGVIAESQTPIKVFYDGYSVGDFYADILVEGSIIIELKSVQQITRAHEVQVVNYLTATNVSVGLILNFNETGVDVKRKVLRLQK